MMDDKDKEFVIEINPFIVILKGSKNMLNKSFWLIWSILSILMIIGTILSANTGYINTEQFRISDFLIPGITGLSFTLALITATTRIFPKEELVDIYLYSDDKNEEGSLFYRTIAPYIWTATIWLIISIGALFSKMFTLVIPNIVDEVLKIIFASVVLMGVMSLWSLLITHIKDISLEAEREIKKIKANKK